MNCVPCIRRPKKKMKEKQQRAELLSPVGREKTFHRFFTFCNQTSVRSRPPSLDSSSRGIMETMRRIFMPSRTGECDNGKSALMLKTPGDLRSKNCPKNASSSWGNTAKVREKTSVSSSCDAYTTCDSSSQMLTVNRSPNFHWEYWQTKQLEKLGFLRDPQVPDEESLFYETTEILQQPQLDEVMVGDEITELRLITISSFTEYRSSPGRSFDEPLYQKRSALPNHEVLDGAETMRTTSLELWPSELRQKTEPYGIRPLILNSYDLCQVSANYGPHWTDLGSNKSVNAPIHHEASGNNRNNFLETSKPQVFQSIGQANDISTSAHSPKADSSEEVDNSDCAPYINYFSYANSAHATTHLPANSAGDSKHRILSSLCILENKVADLQDNANLPFLLDTEKMQGVCLSTSDRSINHSPFANSSLIYYTGLVGHAELISNYAPKLKKQNSAPIFLCSKQWDHSALSELVDYSKVVEECAPSESRIMVLGAELKPELYCVESDKLGITRGARRTARMNFSQLRMERKQNFKHELHLLPDVRCRKTYKNSLRLKIGFDGLRLSLMPSSRRKQPEYSVRHPMGYYMDVEKKLKQDKIPVRVSISRNFSQRHMVKCRLISGKDVDQWTYYNNKSHVHDRHFRYGKLDVYSGQCVNNLPVELKSSSSAVKVRMICGPQVSTRAVHYKKSLLYILGKLGRSFNLLTFPGMVRGQCVLLCVKTKVWPFLNKPSKEGSCVSVCANTEDDEDGEVAGIINSFVMASEAVSNGNFDVDSKPNYSKILSLLHADGGHDMKSIGSEMCQATFLGKTTDLACKTTLAVQAKADFLPAGFDDLRCTSVAENWAKKCGADGSKVNSSFTDEELLRLLVRNRLSNEGWRLDSDKCENLNPGVPAFFDSSEVSEQVFQTAKSTGRRKWNVDNGNKMQYSAETRSFCVTNQTMSHHTVMVAHTSDIQGKPSDSDALKVYLPPAEAELSEVTSCSSTLQYARRWLHFVFGWNQWKSSLGSPFSVLIIFIGVTALAPHFRRVFAWLAGVVGSQNTTS